ncbi:MAG: S28 family serine protease [Kofleriaceae bacterium]
MRHARCALAALALCTISLGASCGGDDGATAVDAATDGTIDAPSGDIAAQLAGLAEVDHLVERPTQWAGYRYFEIWFRQPVDHANPGGATFLQYATLIHRDAAAPMVLLHTGYGNWYYDYPGEVTQLLHANQLVIEHRFFRTSRPSGDAAAWAFLTIEQAAADDHLIAAAMRRLYRGTFVETGASKGGMTSIYHRRFWPDDVDVTVAYVAPISFAAPDYRYEPYLEGIGPAACKANLRALQVELLTNRRAALSSRAQASAAANGDQYTRVALDAAVESAVVSLEWAFWQFWGGPYCGSIPAVTATDAAVYAFLDQVSPVNSSADADLAEFEAYYYQSLGQLGYPGTMDEHLAGLVTFDGAAYDGAYPQGVALPTYSATPMADVDEWVRASADRMVFLYGEWDPWSGGMFEPTLGPDVLKVVAPQGAHGSGISALAPADRDRVLGKLGEWTGVTPDTSVWGKPRPALREPRPPRPPRPLAGW